MSYVKPELLVKYNVIENIFDYRDFDLDLETSELYSNFGNTFQNLFEEYASLYNIKDCCFYIKSDDTCNAFAAKRKGYNIIGITNGYPILLKRIFDKKYFKSTILAGILNEKNISEAYCDLYEDSNFDLSKFILDCSIRFTFNHEFEHILQFNSNSFINEDCFLHENVDMNEFDQKKHIWEFDADRMASFEVLKYVFSIHRTFTVKSDAKLKCLILIGCASMFISKNLFYYEVINQLKVRYSIDKMDFYTKEKSHPHPLVRCFNIMEYYYDNVTEDFPRLKITPDELLNNALGIMKLYFDSLIPGQDTIKYLFDELEIHLDDINQYNNELYDLAINDKAIRNLLISRNIEFEK